LSLQGVGLLHLQVFTVDETEFILPSIFKVKGSEVAEIIGKGVRGIGCEIPGGLLPFEIPDGVLQDVVHTS
jgi:hypothetical protein